MGGLGLPISLWPLLACPRGSLVMATYTAEIRSCSVCGIYIRLLIVDCATGVLVCGRQVKDIYTTLLEAQSSRTFSIVPSSSESSRLEPWHPLLPPKS
jgi:hypothetical protein